MAKILGGFLVVVALFGTSAVRAGFRSPESLVGVAVDNHGLAVTMNFIVVNGPDGWVIYDVESPHDSLRMFLAQYRDHDH
jgi:hypothetical protein